MRAVSRCLVLLLLVLAARSASAQPKQEDLERARTLYQRGLGEYNVANYEMAIEIWKRAYLLSKSPMLLFNIGQAYRLKGDCQSALRFYRNYQRELPEPPNKDVLDRSIARCEETVLAKQPSPSPVEPEPTTGRRARGRGKKLAGLITAGAGALLTGTGLYFAAVSGRRSDDLDGFHGVWGAEQKDLEAEGERATTLAWTLGGLGAAAIVAGGVVYTLGWKEARSNREVTVAPLPGGGIVVWERAF